MKKVLKIVLVILILLIVALGIFAYCNRGIISAFLMAYNASQEELQEKLDSNSTIDNSVLAEYTDVQLRDLTEEEKQKLANNELSEDDAVALVMGILNPDVPPADETEITDAPVSSDVPPADTVPVDDKPTEEPVETVIPTEKPDDDSVVTDVPEQKPEVQTPVVPDNTVEKAPEENSPAVSEKGNESEQQPSDTSVDNETNKKIAELVAKLYVVKARVNSKLNTYIEDLRVEYLANKPTREERVATKPQFAARAIKVVAQWEKECDTEIGAILTEIETLLKESGQSLELVNTIKKAYEDEKAAQKAYCINRYLD